MFLLWYFHVWIIINARVSQCLSFSSSPISDIIMFILYTLGLVYKYYHYYVYAVSTTIWILNIIIISVQKTLGKPLSRTNRPFWGPSVTILDFADGAALQGVSECPGATRLVFSLLTQSMSRCVGASIGVWPGNQGSA